MKRPSSVGFIGDGFVGQYEGSTNRSLTLEFMTINRDEHDYVLERIGRVFPVAHSTSDTWNQRILNYRSGESDFMESLSANLSIDISCWIPLLNEPSPAPSFGVVGWLKQRI